MRKFINQLEPMIGVVERRAASEYLRSGGWLTEFKETARFEQMVAEFLHSKYVSVVSNGTMSLFLSLTALGIGPGDEVIIPDFTMIASANVALMAGATPVFVDIDPYSLCLDLNKVESRLTKRTKALMVVLFNGRAPDMQKGVDFCALHKLYLVEDAAQAFGSQWGGKNLGTFGDVGSFSFSYPKIITTGQGGAVVTNDHMLHKRIRQLKDFGRRAPGVDEHIALGYNFKFSDLLAVVGIAQMGTIGWKMKRKKQLFTLYKKELEDVSRVRFLPTDLSHTCPWFVDIYVEQPDVLSDFLKSQGVGTRPIYPPLHTQAPYKRWDIYQEAAFPVSERISRQGLFLPSSLTLSDADVRFICRAIKLFYSR